MKTLPGIRQFCSLLPLFLFLAKPVTGQEQLGGPQLNNLYYNDSLSSTCEKTAEGCYFKGIELTAAAGSRLFIHFSAFKHSYKDLVLVIMDKQNSGQSKKYFCDNSIGFCLGTIDLDSTFDQTGDIDIVFTSANPEEIFSFTADVYYASPEAMAFNNDQNLCWKIGYILKNSDNGYRFLYPSGQSAKGMGVFSPTAVMMKEAPTESYINKNMSSLSYESTLARGSKEDMQQTFAQVTDAMKICLGANWDYATTTDGTGYQHLDCGMKAPTSGTDIRNLSYMGNNMKDELTKYKISLYVSERMVQGTTIYELHLSIMNLFYQF